MTVPMSIGEIRGLPAHILLVHAVVVLVPLAAALLVLAAWWPAARVRLGPFLPLLAAGCLVLIPITTNAGQWLRERIGNGNPLVSQHVQLGQQLLPWTLAVLLLTLGVWLLGRRRDAADLVGHRHAAGGRGTSAIPLARGTAGSRAAASGTSTAVVGRRADRSALVSVGLAILATVVAVGTIVQVVRIGESGSKAVWQGVISAR